MNLTELINECIRIKPGNKEFALFFDGESEWTAEIGNECQNIGLGEAPAEFSESGCSPEEAVRNLFEALRGVAEAADAIAGKEREANWTGEGLPPVGAELECGFACEGFKTWHKGVCVAVGIDPEDRDEICVVKSGDKIAMYTTYGGRMRPIRTPEQIAAEERNAFISEIAALLGWDEKFDGTQRDAGKLFDAGYRKTEAP